MDDDPSQLLAVVLARLASASRADRPGVVRQLLPLLSDARTPTSVRVAAAARTLRLIPDRDRPVRRVASALTAGLSPSRALERLRRLQHHLESSAALDSIIEAREKRVKLACPRCRLRLPRLEMVKHLWLVHGLILKGGKTRPIARVVEELQEQHATTGNPEPLDRVAALTGAAGLRKWLAGDDLPADDLAPLLARAADADCGLCPTCFAQLPAAVAPLPGPLTFAHGRLAGDGYAIEIGGGAWFRTLRITTPEKPTPAGRYSLAPRGAATLAAATVLLLALVFVDSLATAGIAILAAMAVYLITRLYLSSTRSPADRAVDAAWRRLVPRLAERELATRCLTRLCLASLGHGNPETRIRALSTVIARAAGRAGDSDAELQLLAAAQVLQVEDGARYGRDEIAGIAALAAEGFAGAHSADFAEFVIGVFLSRVREIGDLARLRILLVGTAFDAGLVPRDLVDMCAGAPYLQRALVAEPGHRLGLLFGVWQMRGARPWTTVAPAETVFEMARSSPLTAARLLADYPDLLLLHRPEATVGELIAPLLICARGVAIAGYIVSDPDAEVRLEASGRELVFGRNRLIVARRLPSNLAADLKGWLEFRVRTLLPFVDINLSKRNLDSAKNVLGPFCRRCLECGTVSAVARGTVGRTVFD